MSRLKKRLEETDLELDDLYDYDGTIEDRTLSPEEEKKRKFQHIATAIAMMLVVVVIISSVVLNPNDKKESKTKTKTTTNATGETEQTTAVEVVTEGVDNSFSADQYPDITELVKLYYSAKLSGDTTAIEKYVDNIEDVNMAEIKASNEYIKKYKNIECYTKPGLEDNSYVVFVCYDIKFKNIPTLAPGIDVVYVMRDEETGLVYIHNGATANADIKTYIEALQEEPEVVALFTQVNTAFQEALAADASLNEFYTALTQGTGATQ